MCSSDLAARGLDIELHTTGSAPSNLSPGVSVFGADQIAEIVRAQMPLLAEEDIENAVALCGTLPAGRTEAGKLQGRSIRR